MATNFSIIPVLDYRLLTSPNTRPEFVSQLLNALTNVGFFYLSNSPVANSDIIDKVISYAPRFFDLPEGEKERIRMVNSPHFFGYSRFGAELTKGKVDQREQFDIGTPYNKAVEGRWSPGDPEFLRLWGPSQWPKEELLPGFKATFTAYINQTQKLSNELLLVVAEALRMPPDAFSRFVEEGGNQDRAKIVKYPVPADERSDQGVGPHYDGGFLTLLLQASPHRGLQVQNLSGQWVDAPPIPRTYVVNIGKALETVTQGVCIATSHRVLSPVKGSTPRYSIPFFQMISQKTVIGKSVLDLPPEILQLKEKRGNVGSSDSVNYAEYSELPSGQVALIGRVKSHPDVAERHYPELFKQYFPTGLPSHGAAY
ncbi:Clavaminate synthase-like protein [Cytidiella melzeri]|nr:Clavaminate synthase-like protein [Cytidiella melzeri]